MLESGKRYYGIITSGKFIESQKGTPAFEIYIDVPEEMTTTKFQIWMSPKNREGVIRNFETIGISPGQLANPAFTEEHFNDVIAGKEIVFGMGDNEYKGKTTVVVSWIKRKGAASTKPPREAAAEFFGGDYGKLKTSLPGEKEPDEDEPPF